LWRDFGTCWSQDQQGRRINENGGAGNKDENYNKVTSSGVEYKKEDEKKAEADQKKAGDPNKEPDQEKEQAPRNHPAVSPIAAWAGIEAVIVVAAHYVWHFDICALK
jgi:hypothetical protein